MKTKDIKGLHLKTELELKKLLQDVQDALASLRLDKELNRLKNTRDLFNKRKEVAVLKTILNEKEVKAKNG